MPSREVLKADEARSIGVSSIANLRAIPAAYLSGSVRVHGFANANDGGGDRFYYDSAETRPDDGGGVVRPNSVSAGSPGRWVRLKEFFSRDAQRRMSTIAAGSTTRLTATASSTLSGSHPASKAIDGTLTIDTSGAGSGWVTQSALPPALKGEYIEVSVGPMMMVLLGDSYTEGYPGHALAGGVNDEPISNFEIHLRQMQDRLTVNKGITGNRTGDMLARISADVYAYKPAYCLVLGGTNDISDGTIPMGTTQSNLTSIYSGLVANGTTPILATTLPWSGATGTQKTNINTLNTWIRGQAVSTGYPFVDFYSVLDDPANPGSTRAAETHTDNAHPNATGYARMATAFEGLISQLSRAPRLAGVMLYNRIGTTRPTGFFKFTEVSIVAHSPTVSIGTSVNRAYAYSLSTTEGADWLPLPPTGDQQFAQFRVRFDNYPNTVDEGTAGVSGLGEVIPYLQS